MSFNYSKKPTSQWYITDKNRMKSITLFILSFTSILLFCSCGAGGKDLFAGIKHQMRVDVINNQHKQCLASAQTASDSAECDRKRDAALDEENDGFNEVKAVLEEIRLCQECQTSVLLRWGYPKKEAEKVARKLASQRSTKDYSFDCGDAIDELIKKEYMDQVAIQLFSEALPQFELSSTDATEVVKQYYADDAYVRDPSTASNNPKEACYFNILIGNDIKVTKKLLIDMGLLDDDSDDDDNDDDNANSDDIEDNQTQSDPKPTTQTPSEPVPNNPIVSKGPDNTYQDEASVISKLAVAKYNVDEVNLSPERQQELDVVIAFMKKWPDTKITIVGHTCNIGTDDINNIIGLRRAHQAKLYMVSQGIDENRIEETTKAAKEPCANNDTRESRQLNRRITFIIQ